MVRQRRHLGRYKNYCDIGAYLPTPEEIERKMAEIRSRWSEKERQSRIVSLGRIPVCIQEIKFSRSTGSGRSENE